LADEIVVVELVGGAAPWGNKVNGTPSILRRRAAVIVSGFVTFSRRPQYSDYWCNVSHHGSSALFI